jgi:hypothetical protein
MEESRSKPLSRREMMTALGAAALGSTVGSASPDPALGGQPRVRGGPIIRNFTALSATRPGYASTLTVFVPKLRQAGVDESTIHRITVDNPRRFLAFVPRAA